MEAEIGDAAGAIWQYLDEHGVTTLSKLRQGTKLPDQLLLLGIGWLAREGKLRLGRGGRNLRGNPRERRPRGKSAPITRPARPVRSSLRGSQAAPLPRPA